MQYRNAFFSLLAMTLLSLNCANSDQSAQTDSSNGENNIPTPDGWAFVWGDEFNGAELDFNNKWNVEIAGNGFGNNEAQYYTGRTKNLRLENGKLIIEAFKETYTGFDGVTRNYTSAKITSKKPGFLYGRFEIRAKLPVGAGTWPAIWMLPDSNKYGGWPNSGEIDIMEHVGRDQGKVFATVHTKDFNHMIGTQVGSTIQLPSAVAEFHTYSLEWYPDKLDVFVDSTKYFTYSRNGRKSQ
jgi:beta-glucanase (GH16 family)